MKYTKRQIFEIVGVCALVALMISGAILGIVLGINFKPEVMQEVQPQGSSPLVVECENANGIMLTSGVATTASDGTTSQVITATITPASATQKALEWTIAFKNASSTWATGKTVTDYVTISPNSSDDKYCTVTCSQAFGEQIIVKCASKDYPGIYATATVDYVRKLEGVGLTVDCDHDYETNYHGKRQMRVLDDADTYTFVPTAILGSVYTIDKSYDVVLKWQISEDSNGLFGQAHNPISLSMNGKYNLSMNTAPSVHSEKTVKLSLDFICGEIYGDRFTNTSRYLSSENVAGAQNAIRGAVLEGIKYCYSSSHGYILSATVTCGDYSNTWDFALSEVNVSIPLEAVSLNTSSIQF